MRRPPRSIASAIALCLLVACGGSGGGGAGKTTVKGTLTIPATSAEVVGHPQACNTSQGFQDIAAGTQVRVTDEADTLVGTTQLAGPRRDAAKCIYDFTVELTPGKNFYQFEVAQRGRVSFSSDDLKNKGNTVSLTLG